MHSSLNNHLFNDWLNLIEWIVFVSRPQSYACWSATVVIWSKPYLTLYLLFWSHGLCGPWYPLLPLMDFDFFLPVVMMHVQLYPLWDNCWLYKGFSRWCMLVNSGDLGKWPCVASSFLPKGLAGQASLGAIKWWRSVEVLEKSVTGELECTVMSIPQLGLCTIFFKQNGWDFVPCCWSLATGALHYEAMLSSNDFVLCWGAGAAETFSYEGEGSFSKLVGWFLKVSLPC